MTRFINWLPSIVCLIAAAVLGYLDRWAVGGWFLFVAVLFSPSSDS